MDTTPPSTAEASPPPKLRLMCSYGGHILPRPHDRALTYVGGDTRIVSVDRRAATLPALLGHLAKTLHQNSPFTLRYQLPNEDLDSLISLTTQEDLDNMLEEDDRIVRSPNSNGRIRLFIFPSQNSAVDQQNLLETASNKSEDWFFNRINGKPSTPLSDRGFSESSSVNCLLGLEEDLSKVESSNNIKDEENQKALDNLEQVDCRNNTTTTSNDNIINNITNQDACSVPESPLKVETTSSSFGSTSSSPSVGLVNLPPIKVRVQDTSPKVALGIVEDQLQQMNLEGNYGNLTPPQQHDAVVQQVQHRVQPQSQQFHKIGVGGGVFDLPSPDSVSSDGSFTNPLSRPRHILNQDQNNPKLHIQEPAFILPSHYDPNHPQSHQTQSFVHGNTQYIHSGPVPIASYYPMYPSQQPQQPVLDQSNYPFYIVSTRPPQGYNLPVQQPSYGDLNPATINSTHPHMPNASNVTPHMGFTQSRNIGPSKNEVQSGVYRTSVGVTPQMVQLGQNQGQYVAYGQNHHPSQSLSPLTNPVYAYHEFADSANAGIYYTPLPPQLAAQYQLQPEASVHISAENINHQA